jgi:hypothetical protein
MTEPSSAARRCIGAVRGATPEREAMSLVTVSCGPRPYSSVCQSVHTSPSTMSCSAAPRSPRWSAGATRAWRGAVTSGAASPPRYGWTDPDCGGAATSSTGLAPIRAVPDAGRCRACSTLPNRRITRLPCDRGVTPITGTLRLVVVHPLASSGEYVEGRTMARADTAGIADLRRARPGPSPVGDAAAPGRDSWSWPTPTTSCSAAPRSRSSSGGPTRVRRGGCTSRGPSRPRCVRAARSCGVEATSRRGPRPSTAARDGAVHRAPNRTPSVTPKTGVAWVWGRRSRNRVEPLNAGRLRRDDACVHRIERSAHGSVDGDGDRGRLDGER